MDLSMNSWSFSPLPSPESPYLESPLASGTYREATWDPMEQSFGSLLTPKSTDVEFFSSECQTQNLPLVQKARSEYVVPAAIEYLPPVDGSRTGSLPSVTSSQLDSPIRQSHSPLPMQPNWGRSDSSQDKISTRPSRASKRNKSYDRATSTASSRIGPKKRLRSTSSAAHSSSRPSMAAASCNSPPRQTRLNHNQVEKQYRNRLNGQFEGLLMVLPRESMAGSEEKKVSKAEVLVLARKHIKELERERRRLQDENERLGGVMLELRREWVESGGVVLP